MWWSVIIAVVVGALVYAFWEHRTQSRHLTGLFERLALSHGGEVRAATTLALPQLSFERDGRHYLIGAMATAGSHVAGSASQPGASGPFTFAELVMPVDTGRKLTVLRTDAIDRGAARLLRRASGSRLVTSGEESFDKAFGIKSTDAPFAHQVVDAALRQRLLDTPHQRLEVVLDGAKITVRVGDYAKSAEDLDEMIEIASSLADNCSGL